MDARVQVSVIYCCACTHYCAAQLVKISVAELKNVVAHDEPDQFAMGMLFLETFSFSQYLIL